MSKSIGWKSGKGLVLLSVMLLAVLASSSVLVLGGCGGSDRGSGTNGDPAVLGSKSPTDELDTRTGETIAQPDRTLSVASGKLFLNIEKPGDQSVIEVPRVVVAGSTLPTAMVSANGSLTNVDTAGRFSTEVNLEHGPNYIEIVASTLDGTEVSQILSVIYIP